MKKNGERNVREVPNTDDGTTNNASYFKYHFQISLSAFDFDWKEATITNGAKQPTFSRVFGMSLENFDVLAEMDNIKQHIQVGLRNISMTQYSSSHHDGKERGLNIVCIKPHSTVQLIDGNVEQTTFTPLCDLTVPAKNGRVLFQSKSWLI